MYRVLITIAHEPTKDYPFAVHVIRPDGICHEVTNRSLRDCRIYANGVCMAGGLERSELARQSRNRSALFVQVALKIPPP